MFKFWRRRVGLTEIWIILIPEGATENLDRRFGDPVQIDDVEERRFHEVGQVFLAHDDERSEFLLACHLELTADERHEILKELRLLVGRPVFGFGSAFEKCWALHEELTEKHPVG